MRPDRDNIFDEAPPLPMWAQALIFLGALAYIAFCLVALL